LSTFQTNYLICSAERITKITLTVFKFYWFLEIPREKQREELDKNIFFFFNFFLELRHALHVLYEYTVHCPSLENILIVPLISGQGGPSVYRTVREHSIQYCPSLENMLIVPLISGQGGPRDYLLIYSPAGPYILPGGCPRTSCISHQRQGSRISTISQTIM
jgi:hypothetical protein